MEIFFNSSAGKIQGNYDPASSQNSPVVLLLHSHPDGDMEDSVVLAMREVFVQNRFSALSINFRGVGKSQGKFDQGVGELIDASTALDWLEEKHGTGVEYWIAGFGFGARVAMELTMRRPEVTRFVIASPPVHKYDFSFLSPCPVSGLVLQGSMNSVVPQEEVVEFINKTPKRQGTEISLAVIENADNAFRTKLSQLQQMLDMYISEGGIFDANNFSKASSSSGKGVLLD